MDKNYFELMPAVHALLLGYLVVCFGHHVPVWFAV